MRKRKFNCGYWDKVFEDRMDLLSPEGVEEWGKELMSLEEEPARSSVRKLEKIPGQIYLSTGFLLRRSSEVENPPKLDPVLHLNRVARIPNTKWPSGIRIALVDKCSPPLGQRQARRLTKYRASAPNDSSERTRGRPACKLENCFLVRNPFRTFSVPTNPAKIESSYSKSSLRSVSLGSPGPRELQDKV